ncbi:YceD family protein [Corynebacterium tapiri]|uniref:DUF177 domain-containing protein n=1 Tax=Corynebacterium tapiri TaxID=1448266 RepID=A0A5C4U4Y3_9CORY|nr:YceD family protein [Corynebacterium tapiri]TNL99340.1 DUF177 domain-containing protein [Corynebacterium tapiri]
MNSPFVFNVAELLRVQASETEVRRNSGPSPSRIGPEMIAIAEGEQVVVDASLTPLGGAVLVDADISSTLTGECVRCLRTLRPETRLHISQVFAGDDDFIAGEAAEDGEDEGVVVISGDTADIEQAVVDEAGLSLPFNPVCENGCDEDAPKPDGVSGEEDEEKTDPRWAGLEKFL